jgi:hypothetical protein
VQFNLFAELTFAIPMLNASSGFIPSSKEDKKILLNAYAAFSRIVTEVLMLTTTGIPASASY